MNTETVIPGSVTRYDEDSERCILSVEANEYEPLVHIHLDPWTEKVVTIHLTIEDAWRLAREVARVTVEVEREYGS